LLKWSVKDYLFKAGLCHLVLGAKANDVSGVEKALDKYKDMHPAFDGTREAKLLEDCVDAYNKNDVELFTGHVFKFDSIIKLDNWTASLLLQVKDILKGVGPAVVGGDEEPDLT
jgi:alpha-soluble NSF attachment protein